MQKTVLITGASGGIGKASAELFLEKGWKVIATARNLEKLNNLENSGATVHILDVTKPEDINNLITYIVNNNIKIDVLVNNAGFGQFGTIEETSLEKARLQFETNVFGAAAMCQKIVPLMRQCGKGRIINISSIAGKTSMPGGGWYAASKYALEAISDSLRWETKKFGIKVSLIEPGPIKTDFATNVNKTIVYDNTGPYGKLIESLTGSTDNIKGGSALNCANKIYKAAIKRNPKNRYLVTKEAFLIKFIITVLPPKIVDYFVIKMFISKE
jgi:short-subunit dehydrogenase